MEGNIPNFLVVGAPKSGTTSLYHYLGEHPQIFMPDNKEPKFFSSHVKCFPQYGLKGKENNRGMVSRWEDYLNLFQNVGDEKALGEASADTLYYYSCIPEIQKKLGDPKIVITLRNPVERAFSHYKNLKMDNKENLSFEEALRQEEFRKHNNWRFVWLYTNVGFYSNQIKAYLDNFSQVYIFLYEDLKQRPLETIKSVYNFLEVDASFEPNINQKYKVSGEPKSTLINDFFTHKSKVRDALRPLVKKFLSERFRKKIFHKINSLNLKSYQETMSEETREELKSLFKNDIQRVEKLLGRDLSHWYS